MVILKNNLVTYFINPVSDTKTASSHVFLGYQLVTNHALYCVTLLSISDVEKKPKIEFTGTDFDLQLASIPTCVCQQTHSYFFRQRHNLE